MKKNKTVIWVRLVVSALLALLFLNILIAGIIGKSGWGLPIFHFDGFNFGGTHYADADKYSVGDASLAGTNLTDLEINWLDGGVTVKQGSGDTIEIRETAGSSLSDADKVHYYMNGSKLTIQYRESGKAWSFFGNDGKNKKLEVILPAAAAQNMHKVTIDGTSSKVDVSDIHAESMKLDNVSGDVSLRQLELGNLDSDTVSGAIHASNLVVTKKMESDSVSGSVELQGSIAAMECDSVSGDVVIDSDQTLSELDANSTSGEVKLRIPADSQFEAELDSVSGDLNSDFQGMNKKDKFICGDGSNHYNMDSVSGDFMIQKR